MTFRPTKRATAIGLTVAFLTVFLVAPLAAAAPVAPAAVGTYEWAYGAVRTAEFHGSTLTFAYSGSGTYGEVVILNQTTSSPGNFTLHATRTMGALLSVTFCAPNCAHPRATASIFFHAWETLDAWANLTSSGTVYLSGVTPTAALALVNSSVTLSAHLRESASILQNGTLRARNLSADIWGTDHVTMAPPLGLVPLSLTSGESWNASSAYVSAGYLRWQLNYTLLGLLSGVGTTVRSGGNITLNYSGIVAVNGAYSGVPVVLGGTSYPAVNLTLVGPFELREGFLLVPAWGDLFGGGVSHPWAATQNASATISPSTIDLSSHVAGGGSHLGLAGSGTWWHAKSANPTALSIPGSGPSPAFAGPAATPQNATFVQSSPESISQARSDGACLSSGLGCPTSSAPGLLPSWVLVAAGVVGALVIASAVVAERRRPVRPVNPNAALYPSGSAAQAGSAPAVRQPATPPAPPEDDPLGNLW